MTNLKNVRYAMSVLAAVAAFGMVTEAKAQTGNMTITVDVQNTVTLTPVTQLNFGRLVAIRDDTEVSSIAIDVDGALGTPTNSAPAYIAVSDNAAASRARIEVTDGAVGATLNITIDNVTPPILAGNAFAITAWQSRWNPAGAPTVRTAGATWQETIIAGTNILDLGATLATTTGLTGYQNGAHAGTFDVVFSY